MGLVSFCFLVGICFLSCRFELVGVFCCGFIWGFIVRWGRVRASLGVGDFMVVRVYVLVGVSVVVIL